MTTQPIRIFLSSPGDVVEERKLASEIIATLQADPDFHSTVALEVVAWEKPDGPPLLATMTPQEAINRGMPLPSECDIVMGAIGLVIPPVS